MLRENFEHTDPKLLGKILAADGVNDVWASEDLGAMVRHQLAAPVVGDLEAMFPGEGRRAAALAEEVQPVVVTFGDLLTHPAPPVELLRLVKDMAKAAEESVELPLPREVCAYFYFASIAAAERRAGVSISSLPSERVNEGVRWLLQQPWLDGPARQILAALGNGK